MMQKNRGRKLSAIQLGIAAMLGSVIAGPVMAAEDGPWRTDIIYENATHFRGKDDTGNNVGLSKFRNTLQIEADKDNASGWNIHAILRGTWDGVYRLNDEEYGRKAGSRTAADVQMESTIGGVGRVPVTWGNTLPGQPKVGFGLVDLVEGVLFNNIGHPAFAATTLGGGPGIGGLVDVYTNANSNVTGLRVLGDRWHKINGGVAFAVPVRPCDSDGRGCRDFGGYGDLNRRELENPEFNSNLDFLREIYVKNTIPLKDNGDLFLKIGRQQIVWGRTDLFRVLDVFNPVDYSRNNIYDELQDIRIPLWSMQAEWRMGGSEMMQDRNLQFVWSFDKFRANNLGQCGTPNAILDAGCFFRGMANLWDNGGTVSNFAHFNAGAAAILNGATAPIFGPPSTGSALSLAGLTGGALAADNASWLATNFGPGQIGIRDVHLPKWSDAGTYGVKFEGVTQGGTAFSLNALSYRSQLPSLRAFNSARNPFTSAPNDTTSHLIAFDMHFPRINLIGGSADFQIEDIGAAIRLEGAYTSGEEFANTSRAQLYSKNNVFRSVIGFDRPTFVPFISTTRTTLFSAQLFYQHIFDHEEYQGAMGNYGMPDWKDNFIGTLLIKAFLMNDRLSPQIITAHDFKAKSTVVSPQIEWNVTNDSKLTIGANYKMQNGMDKWNYNDCRDCNPYAPFTAYDQHSGAAQNPATGATGVGAGPVGLMGMEPLGRFRAGPIGSAWKENELYISYRVKF